jgi:hypothetical protein
MRVRLIKRGLIYKGVQIMYAKPVAVLPVVVTTGAAVATLPNTGSNLLVSAALSVGAGLLTWGVVYTHSR